MIHMGGCLDGSASHGYQGGGAFTIALCEAWANGMFSGSYKDLFEKARKLIRSPQLIQYNEFGKITDAFLSEKPYTIESQSISNQDSEILWRAIEIIDRMDLLSASLEEELISSVEQVFPPTSDEYGISPVTSDPQPWLDEKSAIQIAQNEVDGMAGSMDSTWPIGAKVTKVFPIFIHGQPHPSYYECKVANAKGDDAGYVLVNVDKTDLLIPEATIEGPTTTENYQARIKSEDFKVMRFDWLRSLAVKTNTVELNIRDASSVIIDSEGFAVDDEKTERGYVQDDLMKDYLDSYEMCRCFPIYSRMLIDEYYAETEDEIDLIRELGTRGMRGYRRSIRAELRGRFHSTPYGRWHTPCWWQFQKPNGHYIGCGNTAWAIAYAYFKQFHGKNHLFDEVNVDTRHMNEEIREYDTLCPTL